MISCSLSERSTNAPQKHGCTPTCANRPPAAKAVAAGKADRGIVLDIGMTQDGDNRGDATGPADRPGGVGDRDRHPGRGVP
jgi:hypothetical protein